MLGSAQLRLLEKPLDSRTFARSAPRINAFSGWCHIAPERGRDIEGSTPQPA